MRNDKSQTIGYVVVNLRNAEIVEERAKKERGKVTDDLIQPNTLSEQHYFKAKEFEREANNDLARALNVNGVNYLKTLCKKESRANLNAPFLEQLKATFAIDNNLHESTVDDMLVVDLVEQLELKNKVIKKNNNGLYTASAIIFILILANLIVYAKKIEKYPVTFGIVALFSAPCFVHGFNKFKN